MIDKERQSGGEQADESSEPIEIGGEEEALAPCEPAEQDDGESEEYEADAIKFNKDNPDYKEYETKTVTKESKDGYWTYYDEDGGEISKEEYSKYKNKK